MKVGDVINALYRAADILETNGHCKFIQRDGKGRYCAIGAAYAATGTELRIQPWGTSGPVFGDARRKAELVSNVVVDSLGLRFGDRIWDVNAKWGALAEWNNAAERTGEEVIKAFRDAAKGLLETRDVEEDIPFLSEENTFA